MKTLITTINENFNSMEAAILVYGNRIKSYTKPFDEKDKSVFIIDLFPASQEDNLLFMKLESEMQENTNNEYMNVSNSDFATMEGNEEMASLYEKIGM